MAAEGLRGVCVALEAAALPVVRITPRQARDFAKPTGELAKTDALDARVLALSTDAAQTRIRTLKRQLQAIGKMRGQRHIWGGRAAVRNVLYMATLSVICYELAFRDFYAGLKARGKPSKVAMVAVMRKLIVVLNARMREWKTHFPIKDRQLLSQSDRKDRGRDHNKARRSRKESPLPFGRAQRTDRVRG